ncbi:MAG: amidinotransferase [Cyclobacteriaceae bacterium]|nr:amidinotransferase [Cyclobacteriaceae bacterium]
MERAMNWQLQAPSSICMIRPQGFGYNPETSASNAFQQSVNGNVGFEQDISLLARAEFDGFTERIRDKGIEVIVFEESENASTPDAVFPNNWISFHKDGTVILYPMMAPSRRKERRRDIIESLSTIYGFKVSRVLDFSHFEIDGKYLEGTGSIIFDHINNIAYASHSPRTSEKIFYYLCERIGYEPIMFNARDQQGKDIYHTNVLMTLGDKYAMICLEAIPRKQGEMVTDWLKNTDREVINISFDQMASFAGNMIQLRNANNEKYLVMSKSAMESLNADQMNKILQYNQIIVGKIPTIEKYGGGSARCMITGIHLPK